jgi:hypothetical protein
VRPVQVTTPIHAPSADRAQWARSPWTTSRTSPPGTDDGAEEPNSLVGRPRRPGICPPGGRKVRGVLPLPLVRQHECSASGRQMGAGFDFSAPGRLMSFDPLRRATCLARRKLPRGNNCATLSARCRGLPCLDVRRTADPSSATRNERHYDRPRHPSFGNHGRERQPEEDGRMRNRQGSCRACIDPQSRFPDQGSRTRRSALPDHTTDRRHSRFPAAI